MYACKNRAPLEQSAQAQDGWIDGWIRNMVEVPFRMSTDCNYTTTELGEKDKGCDGCVWKAQPAIGSGTPAPNPNVPVGNSLADLRAGESGQPGIAGQGDVGRVADVAEQRRHLEQIWPGAAAYQPTEE